MTEKIGNLGAWLMVFGCAIGITSCQTETKETTGKGVSADDNSGRYRQGDYHFLFCVH